MVDVPKKIETQNKVYEIQETLGEGGTSVVYLAKDGKRDVALKILGEEVDPTFREHYVEIMKNEFEVLSKLRHPNIAEVYDFEYCPSLGKYFFTTEFVKGTDIYNYTQASDYRAKEELFVQLLAALDYVHRCGVMHCDVKCGNALVTQVRGTPIVKLVDFGFATRKLSTGGSIVGTAHYLAPELLATERKDVDHRIDIYAAGIVFYRLLHRAYPYDASSVNNILNWHREKQQIHFTDGLPDYVRQLILKMVATYPSDRIAPCSKAIEFINIRTEGRYKKFVEKIAGLQFREAALVARESLINKTEKIFDIVKEGRSPPNLGIICIGPQGIGKSRVLKEIKYRAELHEIPIREFSCVEGQDHINGFMELFKEIERPNFPETEKSEEKRKLVDVQWINSLLNTYKKKPVLLLLDDLQFSSSPFMKFLAILEERLNVDRSEGDVPTMIIAGIRPRGELNEVVGRWFDKSQTEKVELALFGKDDINGYLVNIGIPNSEKFIESVMAFSGGVPGLVEAYCQHLLSPGGMAKPPANLAQSYLERAKRLSKGSVEALEFISTARRNLSINYLSELTENKSEDVLKSVQELVLQGFASIDYTSMSVRIVNKAISQVIKANMAVEKLSAVSLRLGAWLEKLDMTSLAEIAEYFDEAKVSDRAQSYAEFAAKMFEEKFNNSEAAKFYELALRHVTDVAKKRTLQRAAAKMNILMGNYKDPVAKLKTLIETGDDVIDNYRLLGMAHAKMHDFENAKKWYEAGLKKMTDETAITDIVQFKNSLGNVYFYTGNLEQSEKYFTEAIADATECLLLNNNLGLILSAKGIYDQAIHFYDGRKRFLAAKKNKRALSLCYAECGYIHMSHNYLKEAIVELEESYKIAAEIGDWYNILVIVGNLVRCYQQTAQYSRALEYALKGLEIEGSVGSIEEIAQNHLTIGILYEAIGIFDLAQQHMNAAYDRFVALNNKKMIGWSHLSLSYIYKDLDKLEEATKELDNVDKLAAELKLADLIAWSAYARADLYGESGRQQEAAIILSKMGQLQWAEFMFRKKLLELRLGLTPESERKAAFEKLAGECEGFPELEWEIYSALAEFLERKGNTDEANKNYQTAYQLMEAIASNISEVYRDSYLSQRFRLKIVKRFKPDFYAKTASSDQQDKQTFEERTSEVKK